MHLSKKYLEKKRNDVSLLHSVQVEFYQISFVLKLDYNQRFSFQESNSWHTNKVLAQSYLDLCQII